MAKFRIETKTDPKTVKVYAGFYNPDDAEQPLALMSALGRFRQFTMILEVFSHKILNINVAVYFLA